MLKFSNPDHLWLLVAVPVLLLLWVGWWQWRRAIVQQFGSTTNALPTVSRSRFWGKNLLIAGGIILLAIAWANPQQGIKTHSNKQQISDVFIALDISRSMLCQDVAPSRLELAKIFCQKLVKQLEGQRVGLIFFAGNAFLQMPLTTDYAFILQSLQSASPDMVTDQGTNISAAIEIAEKSFDPEPGGRMLIVITDGETHENETFDRVREALDNGILVYAVGAGTTAGGPIPDSDGGFKRDEDNQVVRTKLDATAIAKMAIAGGGQAFLINQGDAAVEALKKAADHLEKHAIEVRSFSEYESHFQWFLLPALLLLLLEMILRYNSGNK